MTITLRLIEHAGVLVARDDLFPGGTKTRFLQSLFDGADKVVYPSAGEGELCRRLGDEVDQAAW